MRAKGLGFLGCSAALFFVTGSAWAQQPAAKPTSGDVQVGPATVSPHWSRYKYPTSIPDGASYHIIDKGDTLWDLSKKYLQNPYLWPQIWDQNRYITDAHWIYPGDPLILPKVALVAAQAGQAGAGGEEGAGEGAGAGGAGGPGGPGGPILAPVTEEGTLRCAQFIVSDSEDEGLVLIGSEGGNTKLAFATNDIVYLNKGSNAGIKAGDAYTFRHESYSVKHPHSGRTVGTKIETTGWGHVILVEENSASVLIDAACQDIHPGDYVTPAEKPTVPVIARHAPPTRLTPHSGKAHGYVVDIGGDSMIAGTGQMLSIDLGSADGLAPGNSLVVYRTMYPSVPTARNVLGEVTIVAIKEHTATAKVISSNDAILNGDEVELR